MSAEKTPHDARAASRARGASRPWAFWKYNWLANHKIIRALERARPHVRGTLLEVGCGSRPFAWVLEPHVTRYWGTDLPTSSHYWTRHPDVYAPAERLPVRDGSLDTVLGLSMLTCLTEPIRLFEEAARVLKPGGMLVIECTQMAPLHDEPLDYWRFTHYGVRWMLARTGFEPVEFIPIGGLPARVGLAWIAALNRINRGPTRILTEIPVRLLYIVIQLGFEVLDRLFGSPSDPLSNLVVARRTSGPARAVLPSTP